MKSAMRIKLILRYVVILSLVIAATVYYASQRNFLDRYLQHEQREQQIRAIQQQCEDLERLIDASHQRIIYLKTDPAELEDVIRRTENRVRPGETVYRFEKVPPSSGE
jgi:septal ring factor EnvC (AmiA/AmiB activator)